MKKTLSKVIAFALAASLALSGCGGGNKPAASGDSTNGGTSTGDSPATTTTPTASGNEVTDLVYPRLASRELETFNILKSQRLEDGENLTNLYDGLLESNSYGQLQPCIAEDWGTEDNGLTWTFKIREGVKWVDVDGNEKADCNAHDFATGLEWVLNYHKNESANTAMPMEMIKGASEYYEYTKGLSKEEGQALKADEGSKFFEMVGCAVPDDHTVVYTCITEKPYFDTLGTYVALYPAPQALIDELGVDGFIAMNNKNMWYNGCYTMTSYIQGNEKILTKNPMYWDKDAKLFNTVTIKMVESNDVAFQLYQSGEIDHVELTESNVKTISGNESHEFHDDMSEFLPSKYSYQFHFNYQKKFEDGSLDTNWNTAIANENFRRAWYTGLNLSEYYKRTNAINPMKCENNFYTMSGLVYTSDGTEYTELVRQELGMPERNGEKMVRLDETKAQEYKQKAIEELTALGVTFPVEVDHYISASNQTALDSANVLKQAFSDSLGDDFVKLNIKTYVSSPTKEVRDPQVASIQINGWGADYGDPQNYLGQEVYGNDNAYYSQYYSNINKVTEETPENKALLETYREYSALVEAANAINDDLDARYAAFAKAEAYMLDHVLVMPCNYQINWVLTRINTYTRMNSAYGSVNDKMKNWETSVDAYTTEQMEAIEAEHAKGAK